MAIRWDPVLAAAMARELRGAIGGKRTRSVLFDSEARRVILFLREGTLVLELHPLHGWISLLPEIEPFPDARPLNGRVSEVSSIPDDSVLRLRIQKVRGRGPSMELIVELLGNRWNALMVESDTRTIRQVLTPRGKGPRTLTSGMPWDPPPSSSRRGVDGEIPAEDWRKLVEPPDPTADAGREVLRGIAWTSSLNLPCVEGHGGHARWSAMVRPEEWRAFLLQTPRGPQPYPVAVPGLQSDPVDSLLEAMAVARSMDPEAGPTEDLLLPSQVVARAGEEAQRARRRVDALRRQVLEGSDPAESRAMGDLLLARFGEIPHDATSVRLKDFEGNEVTVPLDPALAPHENAARYYDRAARIERARAELPGRIRSSEAEATRWEGLIAAVRSGDLEWAALADALGPDSVPSARTAGGDRKSLPYRRYLSSGGLEIRVGRGSTRNDDLTFRHASPDDIWLHARQAPGAHVILRWGRREENPPRRDLAEAATLAALHSEARHSSSVAVDWTRRKYVRKPRKAPPGAVVPDQVETVFVEPDPDLPQRLSPDGGPSRT
jgi:hypothetical protein